VTRADYNAACVRGLRTAMGFYARRWKLLSSQYQERDRALDMLSNAARLRDLAKRWEANPV
jgi:hypothetical protein